MLIVYNIQRHRAWQPIHYMVKLAAELMEAEVFLIEDNEQPGLLKKLDAVLGRRPNIETCLVVCRSSWDLTSLFLAPSWRKRFRRIVAWVIDSFWVESIPRIIRYTRPFDRFFITTEEDVAPWQRIVKTPTTCLPWGTDVLRLGSGNTDRKWDLLRVGRQPEPWDSDSSTQQACADLGLQFHGRPGDTEDPDQAQKELMQNYSLCKFLLAFSNAANPTNYTHPTREYFTARWVDALASGSIVAGIAPKTVVADQILWPGATLELGTTDRERGLQIIAEAARAWSPEQAIVNYRNSLAKLDWRWRFATIADDLGLSPKPLKDELQLVKQAYELQKL